jgi:hypothetical protein
VRNYLWAFCVVLGLSALSGCESNEDNAMNLAQNCFNKATTSAEADICLNYIAQFNSPKASLLKCGISFFKGGLTTNKIITAFDDYDEAPANQKEALLIERLALASNAPADAAYAYCNKAESPGMLYVAGLVRMGTYMKTAAGGTGDPDDLVDACIAAPSTCATAEMGQMLIDVGDLYCQGSSASQDVCTTLNSSIAAHPGDPQGMIAAFLASINY